MIPNNSLGLVFFSFLFFLFIMISMILQIHQSFSIVKTYNFLCTISKKVKKIGWTDKGYSLLAITVTCRKKILWYFPSYIILKLTTFYISKWAMLF